MYFNAKARQAGEKNVEATAGLRKGQPFGKVPVPNKGKKKTFSGTSYDIRKKNTEFKKL
jgi:hypothetical protein